MFDVERGAGGIPILKVPETTSHTPKTLFERRCYLNGVTEGEVVAKLWEEEKVRIAARKAANKEKVKEAVAAMRGKRRGKQ